MELAVKDIRLTEKRRHGAIKITVIVGGLNGIAQLLLLGIRHFGANGVAAVYLPVAIFYQQQDHIIGRKAP